MFQKEKNKTSKLFKGSAAVLATAISLSFFPVGIGSLKADYVGGGIGSEAIIIENINQKAKTTGEYEIRAAYFGSESKIPVGLQEESEGVNPYASYFVNYDDDVSPITNISSSVKVTYANSNAELTIDRNSNADIISGLNPPNTPKDAVYGTVVFTEVGEYIVEYNIDITVDGEVKHFSTEYSVYSELSDAYFDFAENDANIIPSIYDIALVKAKNNGAVKDLKLPLPKVFNEKDEEQDVVFLAQNPTSDEQTGGKAYVVVSVSGSKPVVVESTNDEFFIPSRYFDSTNDAYAGTGNFVIKYSYFTPAGQFVSSFTQTYRVEESYYEDYELNLSLSTSQINAVTGVAVELPKLQASTGDNTTPSGETVSVSYTIKALRKDSTGSYAETRDGSIVDGKFTPWADGDYLIEYVATDFYGNTKTYKDLYIDGVKDTQAPIVIAYDAGDKENFNTDGSVKEYIDASTYLKSKTQTNNIVVYAVGATDNVSTVDEMELIRTISSSSKTIEIGNQYAKYNIIFDFDVTKLADNKTLLALLNSDAVDTDSEEAVKEWLKSHNYLIATVDESKTIEDGYAYLNVKETNELILNGSNSGISYTVRYKAKDGAGNNATALAYTMTVTNDPSFADSEAPSITFPTSLKNSYRTDAIITFDKPTASDDNDTRMQVKVEYVYTGAEGHEYKPIVLDDDYKIDLSEIFSSTYEQYRPVKVTIRVTAEDDYKNVDEWTKEIEIADVVDNTAPTIFAESYSSNPTIIEQNSEVLLPTITYTDDNVKYMNTQVYVNSITYKTDSTSDDTSVRVETPVAVTGKKELQKSGGIYRVFAGKFVAAYEGLYEVKVVATDAGGNQITTFYYYEAQGTTYVSEPKIQAPNVIGDSGKIELGTEIEFETPTVSYSLADNQGIIGVSDDDSKSATDYDIVVTNDSSTAYEFDGDVFTAKAVGSFTFEYNVRVTIFDKDVFENQNGALIYKTNGGKAYQLSNQDIVVLTSDALLYGVNDQTNITLFKLNNDSNISVANGVASATISGKTYKALITNETIEFLAGDGSKVDLTYAEGAFKLGGTSLSVGESVSTVGSEKIKTYNLVSDPIRATVQDTTAPTMPSYDYPSIANLNEMISIGKIKARDSAGIDKDKSYVLISYRGGSSSRSTTIYMKDWNQNSGYNSETGDIDYKLDSNGNYTITYYIYDIHGNLNDDCTYSIAVGDCESPKIELPESFVEEKYELGSTLTLDYDKIREAISDNISEKETLLDTLKIKLINTSTNKEVENTEDADSNRYSYVLDEAGTYSLEITVTDEAGWETTNDTIQFEVSTEAGEGMNVYEIIGIVLIVLACLTLAGVILYFVINKVKKDKKRKLRGVENRKSADSKSKDNK